MFDYIVRRLILLPITLLGIILVNFIIINLAPTEPESAEMATEGGGEHSMAFGNDDRYLQFREYYGLTLPILLNNWPSISKKEVYKSLWQIQTHNDWKTHEELSVKDYDDLRVGFGDRARFVMPFLLGVIENDKEDLALRRTALLFFVRGGTRQAFLGPNLSDEQNNFNRKIAQDGYFFQSVLQEPAETKEQMNEIAKTIREWYEKNKAFYHMDPQAGEKIYILFFETRFVHYMSRVLKLDFGTMRNDPTKTVLREVTRRFKYSFTLAILPLFITFVLCLLSGFIMAYYQNQWPDISLNFFYLFLYSIPVFIAAPFLIEKVALYHSFPFTDIPIPISGFSSSDDIYERETPVQKVLDIARHILLPIIAIMYGNLAAQSRLSRTAILEVMRQDFVRTDKAKGLHPFRITKHIGRNASITIVTSIAGSLRVVLGGSVIVETLFEINGFGKFFYDGIIDRDYNVIMFSAVVGSLLSLFSYLLADIVYTLLDPRVTLE